MKYVVIVGHPLMQRDPCMFTDIQGVVGCQSLEQVQEAINANRVHRNGDWTVFELVDGKFQQRSVCFEPDGRTVKNVQ
jgi:hypothetical protein